MLLNIFIKTCEGIKPLTLNAPTAEDAFKAVKENYVLDYLFANFKDFSAPAFLYSVVDFRDIDKIKSHLERINKAEIVRINFVFKEQRNG